MPDKYGKYLSSGDVETVLTYYLRYKLFIDGQMGIHTPKENTLESNFTPFTVPHCICISLSVSPMNIKFKK